MPKQSGIQWRKERYRRTRDSIPEPYDTSYTSFLKAPDQCQFERHSDGAIAAAKAKPGHVRKEKESKSRELTSRSSTKHNIVRSKHILAPRRLSITTIDQRPHFTSTRPIHRHFNSLNPLRIHSKQTQVTSSMSPHFPFPVFSSSSSFPIHLSIHPSAPR